MHSFCYCDKDPPSFFFFFFFNDTATTEIYTLSLHDALPIACPRNVFVSKSTKHHPRRVASADSHDETAAGGNGLARLRGDQRRSFPCDCISVGEHFNSHGPSPLHASVLSGGR